MIDIPSGTQNVILYCICTKINVAVVSPLWFINGAQVTHTQASGNNPYYRDNVPAPLIITSFTADNVGTYGCKNFFSARVTIDLAIFGMCMITVIFVLSRVIKKPFKYLLFVLNHYIHS